jgi:hypothetical protein
MEETKLYSRQTLIKLKVLKMIDPKINSQMTANNQLGKLQSTNPHVQNSPQEDEKFWKGGWEQNLEFYNDYVNERFPISMFFNVENNDM